MKKTRHISLRVATLFLTGICLVFFTSIFFFIFTGTMPNMLMSIETKYLQEQTDFITNRFDDVQHNICVNALNIGAWNESVLYVRGENPRLIENRWSGTTPTRVFRYNLMIITDAEGNNLFSDFYDYVNDQKKSAPPGFASRLSALAVDVASKNQAPRSQNATFEDFGKTGIVIYDHVPYYISIMPIMPSRTSGGAVGAVVIGLVIDNDYFRSLSKLEEVTFEWEQTSAYLQRERGNVSRDGQRFAVASVPIVDIYGNPAQLFMSGPRHLYTQGLQQIYFAGMLMFGMALFLVFLLYLIINRMILHPIEKLKTGISGIAFSGNKLGLSEISRTREFGIVGDAINDMVDRLNQTKTMQSVLEGMDAYLYVTDPKTDRILFISKKMYAHIGLTGDVVGAVCWKALQKDCKTRCELCPLHKLDEDFPDPVEWEEQNALTGYYYKNIGKLIKWVDGRTVLIRQCTDISAEKEYARLLLEAKEIAEQASLAKGNFLSNMSHEIRTPMNAIIGMTSIGKSASDIDKKDYAFERIENASTHLLGIINDILDVSKIESGKFELSSTEFCFENMLKNVVNVISFKVDEKEQQFSVYVDRAIPQVLIGDDHRLAQVITNLLGNAVKFTPKKGAVGVRTYFMGEEDGLCKIKIAITDTGIGISPQQQAKLFQSFQQAESSTSRKFGGTGLGLAISKSIVEMMGGEIWIESELGKGATFAFYFKMQRGKTKEQNDAFNKIDWKNVRILVVDDDTHILEDFKGLVEKLGATCDTAANGADALKLIEQNGDYNIYFVDWKMPEMNGIELTKKIKQKSQTPDKSTVIMISAAEASSITAEAKEAGVSRFLQKPLFPSTVANIVSEYLGITVQPPEEAGSAIAGIFKGHRILLAEDVEINREIALALLEPTNLEIDCAVNGEEAVHMFSEAPEKYDIILMDLQMPKMDGYKATKAIRTLDTPKAKTIPIIAMTANVFREDIEKCLEAGMNDHTGKPIDAGALFGLLSKYLKHPEEIRHMENIYKFEQGITWNDDLSTGNTLVDMQHRTIFERVSDYIRACENGNAADKLEDMLFFLADYTIHHFSDEEAMQIEYDYPDYKYHSSEHDKFKATVADLIQKFREHGLSAEFSGDFNKSVTRWLITHIQNEDKKMTQHIRKTNAIQ